ncbi:MAG: carbamoyl-phosphate synthase large subunit [Lachnospiraceae bacterium]|nr:carbamoyl-phosphate synthase large subunit [Lachnospiraceae bacterium]
MKEQGIRKICVIGSGPIVVGQAAEFDYAGTQACMALKEEGYEVILCNSNPATIMTDPSMADRVYMEPLTLKYMARILRYERPDALIAGLGGQTALNLAVQLSDKGVLSECHVRLLGTGVESIRRAEDRELFKELCESLAEPVLPSEICSSFEEGVRAAEQIGYPVVLRPAFTLGGTGGGFAADEEELRKLLSHGLELSPVGQVLIEKSVKGYKEIEFEVMRDKNDTAVVVCAMENLDPVGIHTGDSVVVCPTQTLTNREYQMLRDSALKLIRALKIEGGCNVQFALDPVSMQYYLIEVNPRVSRSSALASKASGYPIARVSAKIAVGMSLDEIMLANTPASFEPALDYVVCKLPRFAFDKYQTAREEVHTNAAHRLGTQMMATGEVMSVGRTFEESLLKGIRSLETGLSHVYLPEFDTYSESELLAFIGEGTDERLCAAAELLRRGIAPERIHAASGIDLFFIDKLRLITEEEKRLKEHRSDYTELERAKKMGFSDREAARLWDMPEKELYEERLRRGIRPVYKMIDTCASEFESYVPYFYSSYEEENESVLSEREKIIVLGAGPIRIGQGIEFDYSTVHAVKTIQEAGYEAIIINNNPETVSTDYTIADKLYFEPLTTEDVMHVIEWEKPVGVIASLGGQTAINLAGPLSQRGVRLIGTGLEAIDTAEDRELFEALLQRLHIPMPKGIAVTTVEEGLRKAEEIGYPVLVRPSFVLGGRAMQIVAKNERLRDYLNNAFALSGEEIHPVLIDQYISGRELEVDAICDGKEVFIPGIMELVERTGVHSGDSISVFPTYSVSEKVQQTIREYTEKLGIGIGIIGLFNIQFIVDRNDNVYIIEVNPRSSRTVPFLSKATGIPLADIATRVALGLSLRSQDIKPSVPSMWYVKAPAFSFSKLHGMDAYLSPEMKSTGEAIGYDKKLHRAIYKALIASGVRMQNYGTVIVTLADEDKDEALPLIRRFYELGFNIEGTTLTAEFLKANGIRTRVLKKLSEGSTEILQAIRAGYVSYVINTRAILSGVHYEDGEAIRRCAAENNVTMFTSLDTVRVLLDVLEEITIGVSPIHPELIPEKKQKTVTFQEMMRSARREGN